MTYSLKDFLEIKTASVGSFSPDGSKLIVHSNLTGTSQLHRIRREGGALTRLTDRDEPTGGGYLPASDRVLVTTQEGGNERIQLSLMNDDGTGLEPLVHDPDHIHRPGGFSRDGKMLAYASNRRNDVDFDVYVRDMATGDERLVFDMGGWCSADGFSPDGRYLAVTRLTERNGDNDVYLVDLALGEQIHLTPHDEEASFSAPRWMPDGSSFFFATDQGHDFRHIRRYDMRTGSDEQVLVRENDLGCVVDWAGTKLLVSVNSDGFREVEIFDPRSLRRRGAIPVPRRGITDPRISRDGRYIASTFISPVDPGDVWLTDTVTGSHERLTNSPTAVPTDLFVEPTVHRFTSFDGEQIPVLLFRPRKPLRDPAPVIVSIHGGPESQYTPSFNPMTQFFLHRGYAVVAPNVRGSTGYGKRFHHLDDVYKRLDSVRDLASLHAWLQTQPGLDPSRAVLMGGSYGGYMTLAGLAFQPELWAAGVDIVGMSSLVTFLENTAPWRRKFREREYGSLEHDREFLTQVSPLTHVERIRAPLMIIHGANDPRCPVGEAEQIHREVSMRGVPSELLIYPDEGHGLGKLKNRLDAYPKAVDFLDRVLAF